MSTLSALLLSNSTLSIISISLLEIEVQTTPVEMPHDTVRRTGSSAHPEILKKVVCFIERLGGLSKKQKHLTSVSSVQKKKKKKEKGKKRKKKGKKKEKRGRSSSYYNNGNILTIETVMDTKV